MRFRFILFPLACGLLSLCGCGYHTLGSATHVPATVQTIAIPTFTNKSQYYHTEVAMTQAVIREFTDRTRLSVLTGKNAGEADATLNGVILGESVQPLTYNTATNITSSFLITITANVVLTDRDHHVLYQHEDYVFHQQYETTTDLASFIEEDSPAVQRLSRDFAQTLVSDILDSF